jgi:hypothetical protein
VSASSPLTPEFQRAFVAMRYFLGARGEGLGAPLGDAPEATATEARLAHPERERRAEALALEIGRVMRALEARSYR